MVPLETAKATHCANSGDLQISDPPRQLIQLQNIESLKNLQALTLAQRFRLSQHIASLVASLAFTEARQ
jgi:hypothetical protein